MIIGISGKKQSGKDTVGKIIQYLTMQKLNEPNKQTFEEFNKYYDSYYNTVLGYNYWQIVKFADKVKDIVCLLIGCTREQLEDEVFKNTELGSEWDIIYKHSNAIHKSMVKDTNMSMDNLELITSGDFKGNYRLTSMDTITKLTPRKLMQLIGTDVGRVIHPNCWVNATMKYYMTKGQMIKAKARGHRSGAAMYLSNIKGDPINWIITDVRFPNELKSIEDRGGFVIRVERPTHYYICDECMSDDIQQYELKVDDTCPRCNYESESNLTLVIPSESNHESETSLDSHKFKYTIDNNGTIDELIKKVKLILEKEGIL
jgi:hypothetical protein